MDGRIVKRVDGWVNEFTDGRAEGWMGEWTEEQMDGWWVDGWVD